MLIRSTALRRVVVLRMRSVFAAFIVVAGGVLPPVGAQAAPKSGLECTQIKDLSSGAVRRDGVCDQRLSPFSTIKLPMALVG